MSAKPQTALSLSKVTKNFGAAQIIRSVDLDIPAGERHAIIGPNGAGKSTLFNLISGAFPPSSGEILVDGQPVAGAPPFEINRRGLSRSFQVTNIFHNMSVYENLRCATLWALGHRYVFWRSIAGMRDVSDRSEEILDLIGLAPVRNSPAGLLSYADQRALEIGVTIAGGAKVILLDEPTAGMSRAESAAMVALIREVTVGKTLLMVEHDMQVVFGLADRIAVMDNGRVIACDSAERIRANPDVQALYLDRRPHG